MKAARDLFSKQSSAYKKYRPTYPEELYELILDHTPGRSAIWDVGCGNGQVAAYLASHFEEVQATDVSENQISLAVRKPNIQYSVGRAEKTNFKDRSFDLITVGQAIHWFDHEAFNQEVQRVLKPGGVLAVWGYGLLRIHPEIDPLLDHYYQHIIGPYWAPERKHVDTHYQNIPFPFKEIKPSTVFYIKPNWTLDDMEGYLRTWSSLQTYHKSYDIDPVPSLIREVKDTGHWEESLEVRFPIFCKVGRYI